MYFSCRGFGFSHFKREVYLRDGVKQTRYEVIKTDKQPTHTLVSINLGEWFSRFLLCVFFGIGAPCGSGSTRSLLSPSSIARNVTPPPGWYPPKCYPPPMSVTHHLSPADAKGCELVFVSKHLVGLFSVQQTMMRVPQRRKLCDTYTSNREHETKRESREKVITTRALTIW